jgi:integrase
VIDVNAQRLTTPTKTGQARTVALPPSTTALLKAHISATRGTAKSPMFVDHTGRSSLTRNATQQAWRKATKALGLDQFHVHDVRHAGLTLAAQAGATTRELMARAGHRTTAAAMTYQHVAEERSALLAERMDALTSASATGTYREASGTYRAREAINA